MAPVRGSAPIRGAHQWRTTSQLSAGARGRELVIAPAHPPRRGAEPFDQLVADADLTAAAVDVEVPCHAGL